MKGIMKKKVKLLVFVTFIFIIFSGIGFDDIGNVYADEETEETEETDTDAGNGTYTIAFDGNGATSGVMDNQIMHIGTDERINQTLFKRKGYTFVGWSVNKKGFGDGFSNRQKVMNLTETDGDTIVLYAQWELKEYKIKYMLSGGNNTSKNPKKYNIETSTIRLAIPGKSGYGFMGWYRDKYYRNQVESVPKGSTGDITLYAKWAKFYAPTKASGRITKCTTGVNKIVIEAKVPKLIKSSDEYYYLVRLEPDERYVFGKVAKVKKGTRLNFKFDITKDASVLYGRLALAVKSGGRYNVISNSTYVNNIENIAANKQKYHIADTKKGIQFTTHDDLKSTGAKNTFFNLPVSYIVSGTKDVPFTYNGKTYHFSNLNAYRLTFTDLNRLDVNVTMQILLDWGNGACSNLIAREARVPGKHYYTWNTVDKSAREEMEAIFAYIASIFGKEKCYVSNWVLGNEVNACDVWNYRGSMSDTEFVKSYAFAYTQLYRAVKSNRKYAKVFTCIDHTWGIATDGMGGKEFITGFSQCVNKLYKGINWNLAFHAYPVPLYEADFWNNGHTSNDENTKYITMQNIDVLTNYIRKHYGSKTRIILSEQGFTAKKGQDIQAAAIALSYYKVACNSMIDAIIIRSYTDAPSEAAMGLSMGIKGRKAFKIFKYMDTPKSLYYTKGLLRTIGVKSWAKVVPHYSVKHLLHMYRRE